MHDTKFVMSAVGISFLGLAIGQPTLAGIGGVLALAGAVSHEEKK